MKLSRALPVLAFVLGIGLLAFEAQAEQDYGPLFDYPAIKGQSAFTFLKVGQSPRAVGMGEAFAAMPGDIDAIYYNPGGLGFLQGRHYTFTYTKWFRSRLWQVKPDRVKGTYVRRGWLLDRIEVHYEDDERVPRVARFVFTKDRKQIFEQFAAKLEIAQTAPAAAAPPRVEAPPAREPSG